MTERSVNIACSLNVIIPSIITMKVIIRGDILSSLPTYEDNEFLVLLHVTSDVKGVCAIVEEMTFQRLVDNRDGDLQDRKR